MKFLDEHLRVRLADLDPRRFELFFLDLLGANVSLSIERHGSEVTRKIISASTYAAGTGRKDEGIDVHTTVEGGEVWAFSCKRVKKWGLTKTREAIQAVQFRANHYFLIVTCDPSKFVYDEMLKHPNWTLWNLDKICAEIKRRIAPARYARVLSFLPPEELKRFVPFTSEGLITPDEFFKPFLGADKLFRHDWHLVGRESDLQALRDFVSGPHKVQVLCAKGGDGKSRLLWEICRTLATEAPDAELLFLNPHRSGDDFSFGFIGDPPRRLILVDDAHRTEQVPMPLLSHVRQDPVSKLLLATRPQGVEALACKLYEAGLSNELAPQRSLASLKKADVMALATEALGESGKEHASELAELTADCPFLTVLAGELLRLGRLEWGGWANNDAFRRIVFQEFVERNFEPIPEADRNLAEGLIRLLALLAPMPTSIQLPERAARILGSTVFALETQMGRLRQSELVAGRDDGLRIVPDLLADFLVYDACYGPKKTPAFVKQIVQEFEDRSPALLRNLSEATWLARSDGVADEDLLKAFLEPEHRRFESASFFERAQILRHWTDFSVFLPAESLDLARKAITLKTASVDQTQEILETLERYDHDYVCARIPGLLSPIANHHDLHRHAALDVLWDVALQASKAGFGAEQSASWRVIADGIKYEPKRPVYRTLDALAWLQAKLRTRDGLSALERPIPILRTLLGPCFDRLVEFNEREGRTFRWWQQPVLIDNTQPIRDRALSILEWTIEHGSQQAVLSALSALETAIARPIPSETKWVKDEGEFRVSWRPERLKGLALYEKAIAKLPNVAVRYEIRQTLKRDLLYEEDSVFAEECRRVLARIPGDLALRVAVAVLSQGVFEFREDAPAPKGSDPYEKVQALWIQQVHETTRELATANPTVDALLVFLEQLTGELTSAGNHPVLDSLFAALVHENPDLAARFAARILEARTESPLASAWPALIETNRQIGDPQRMDLFRKAVRSRMTGAGAGVVRHMASQASEGTAFNDDEKALLLDIAAQAGAEEAFRLLQLVELSSDANLPWTFQILKALPIREIAPRMMEQVFQALVPYRERKTIPPPSIVRHVLAQLVPAPDLDVFRHQREWDVLTEKYPREIYEFILARIAFATAGSAAGRYRPIPTGYRMRLRLPALAEEPDYPTICNDLWNRVSGPTDPEAYAWMRLFQAVVFENRVLWPPRMSSAITSSESEVDLLRWITFLQFDDSVIIFRFPEITRTFLSRAQELGGNQLLRRVRIELYSGCGPRARGYSNGILDRGQDYVEAEAGKAAESHATDELLGPFYRWIVEVEQKERLVHRMHADAAMGSLD